MSDSQQPAACSLARKDCAACRGDVPALKGEVLTKFHEQLDGWDIVEEHHIEKIFKFKNFAVALAFVNRVGELAEQQGHHPWIGFTWGEVEIRLYTHKVSGLTESDFILAAKIDELSR